MDGPLSIKKTQLQQTTTVQKLNDEGRKQHYVLETNVYHEFCLRLKYTSITGKYPESESE